MSLLEQTGAASVGHRGGSAVAAEELRPELERLGVVDAAGAPPDLPGELSVGSRSVRLDGWERMILRAYGIGPDARGRPWPTLVAHAIALRMRDAARDPDRTAARSPEERARVVAGLRGEAAVADAVLAELEWSRSRLTDEGETRVATRITELIDRVDRMATHLREFLGEGASSKAGTSFDPLFRERWPAPAAGPPAAEVTASPSRRPARGRSVRLRLRRTSLVTIAVLAAAVAAIVWSVPLGPRRPGPTAAGLGPVFRLPAVVDAGASAGVTTVTIDAGAWARLPETRRSEMLETIGATARAAGHPRVELRTIDGRPLTPERDPVTRP